jgi:Holliday junction resolvase
VRERRTQYARGADFERKVRDHLMHDLDACYVVRSAGSRGIVDLVAFFTAPTVHSRPWPVVWLVQCKRGGVLSKDEHELLMSLAAETGGRPMLAYIDVAHGLTVSELAE